MRWLANPVAIAMLLAAAAVACAQSAQTPPAGSRTLDAVVAVVNNHAILRSEVDEEMQLAVLEPVLAGQEALTPAKALDLLIGRTLVEQQIRREEERAAEPSEEEVRLRLSELRSELPACVHSNCASDQGWAAFLAAHRLTPERIERSVRRRVQILRFIELRFRQGIRIAPEEVEAYYREVLLPQYKPGETVPALEAVSQRIEEILLEKRVSVLFDEWLNNLRKQGDVEVLDPELETAPQGRTAGSAAGKEVRP